MGGEISGLWLLLGLVALPSAALAHRLDEYLQATLVAVEPAAVRLQINLTPGVAVADQVLSLIDRDRDGVISTSEAAAYAQWLKRDLIVRLDRRKVELKLTASSFPDPTELLTGLGIIQMEFSVTPGVLAAGPHKLTLENRHLPAASVYLFNAARPRSASLRITGQKRNDNQSQGEIAFDFDPPPRPSISVRNVVSVAALFVVLFAGVRYASQSHREGPPARRLAGTWKLFPHRAGGPRFRHPGGPR